MTGLVNEDLICQAFHYKARSKHYRLLDFDFGEIACVIILPVSPIVKSTLDQGNSRFE